MPALTVRQFVSLPTTVGSSVILTNMFNTCYSLESMTIPSGWTIGAMDSAFLNCYNIKTIVLPNNTQNSITSMSSAFSACYKLENLTLPTSLTSCTAISFSSCYILKSITLPATMNSITSMFRAFISCYKLESVTLPTSMTACTTFSGIFQSCYSLKSIVFPTTISASNTDYSNAFNTCTSLTSITFPTTQNTSLTTLTSMFTNCASLKTLINTDKLGSLTTTPLVTASLGTNTTILTSLSFNCPFSLLNMVGTATSINKLNSVRLLNTSTGQYTGTSPQIDFSYCSLGITALNQLFTDLPTVTGKTINITGTTGATSCTRSIATAKGWTVTG